MKVDYKNRVVQISNVLLNEYAFDHKYTFYNGLICNLERTQSIVNSKDTAFFILEAKTYALKLYFYIDEGTFRITRCKIEEGSCTMDDVGITNEINLSIKRFRKVLDEQIIILKEAYETK
jgi:hypothetical protein